MTLIDLIKLAASNLWRRRMRSVLTVLGVIIGTACIIVMITLGISNLEQTEQQFADQDLDMITVSSGDGGMMGGMAYPGSSSSGSSGGKKLNESTLKQFAKIDGVEAVSPVYNIPLYVKVGKYQTSISVIAMDTAVMSKKEFYQGGWFNQNNSAPELVVPPTTFMDFRDPNRPNESFWDDSYYNDLYSGEDLDMETYKLPGPDINWMETTIKVTFGDDPMWHEGEENYVPGRTYNGGVCGIIDPNDIWAYESFISLNVAKTMIRDNRKLAADMGLKDNEYQQIRVKAGDRGKVRDIMARIQELGYQPQSSLEQIELYQEELRRQQSQLLMIAAITLLVSAIGIANTMLTTILERRSEIGVMKVVGMKIRSINFLFLTEASIIGAVGGIIGTAFSYFIIYFLNNNISGDEYGASFMGLYLGENVNMSIPPWLILVAVGIAMLTGLLSGIYPAYKATKMSPLEAIRSN